MLADRPTHAFTNFRTLCHLMIEYDLLGDLKNLELIKQLLFYNEDNMAGRHWAKAFYEHKLEQTQALDNLFIRVAGEVIKKDAKDWGPPFVSQKMDEVIHYMEKEHEPETGHYGFNVYKSIDQKEVESAKPQDYPNGTNSKKGTV